MGFTEGQIVSPSDADWNVETVAGLHCIAAAGRQNEEGFARYRAAWQHSCIQLILIFPPLNKNSDEIMAGFSWHRGPSFAAMDAWYGWDHDGILKVIAHELGHALFDWPHPNLNDVCLHEWSLTNQGGDCQPFILDTARHLRALARAAHNGWMAVR